MAIRDIVLERARRAGLAAASLRTTEAGVRSEALQRAAELLRKRESKIMRANAIDLEGAQEKGLSAALVDRLTVTGPRLEEMAQGLREVADFPDPLGEVIERRERPNGLRLEKVRVPLGVIGIIYESRPNVTVDAAGLCLKAGSACVLRGGSEALHTNLILAEVMQEACLKTGLPDGCVEIIPTTEREAVYELAKMDQYLSLIVPRGGEALIRAVCQVATVPVIKHHRGLTQIYVDRVCDVAMAVNIVHNAKVQRPGVCNAVETLVVHRGNEAALRAIVEDLRAAGVELRGCEVTRGLVADLKPAEEADWDTEYLDLILSIRTVDSFEAAVEHIAHHSSGLSEAIITSDEEAGERFLREVDSACVYLNASTRFTDGGQFGLGAEIGISTDKIHARGPMGVRELTSYKYVIRGTGQVRT